MNFTAQLAGHVTLTRYEDLSPQAVRAAKIFLLDTIGVGVAGGSAPFADKILAAARGWGAADEVTVWGNTAKLPAPAAAFVNAYQIHCQEFDCVHTAAVVHPMATVGAATMAAVERLSGQARPVSGRELIVALAVAVDVATSLGIASNSPLKFFRPATAGIFGATASVARLHGFDVATLRDAWGLALAQASGTMQAHIEGKPTLAVQIGFAARGAIVAADLAAAGIPGPSDMLQGPFGYLPLMEADHDVSEVQAALGKIWRIAEISHKVYPTGGAAQSGISAILQLQKQHGFTADDVAEIVIAAPPLVHRLVGRPIVEPLSANYARLCLQYCGATALDHGIVDIPDFRDLFLASPLRHELAKRIRVEADGNPDPNALSPQRITVRTKAGAEHVLDVPAALGAPANPLSLEQHLEKFRRCWKYGVRPLPAEGADRMIDLVDRLEALPDSAELVRCMTPATTL